MLKNSEKDLLTTYQYNQLAKRKITITIKSGAIEI